MKPETYKKCFIERIIQKSVSKDFISAILEWEDINSLYISPGRCLCTRTIMENYEIINKITKEKIIVGNCCINKFHLISEQRQTKQSWFRAAINLANNVGERDFVSAMKKKVFSFPIPFFSKQELNALERIAQRKYTFKYILKNKNEEKTYGKK